MSSAPAPITGRRDADAPFARAVEQVSGALALAPLAPPPAVQRPRPVEVAPPAPRVPAETPSEGAAQVDAEAWRSILARVRVVRASVASVLEHALPMEVGPSRVVVGFEPGAAFLAEQAKDPEALELLTREVRAHFGAPTEVALNLSARARAGQKTLAAEAAEKRRAELAEARADVARHPLIADAVKIFGAEVKEIVLPGGDE